MFAALLAVGRLQNIHLRSSGSPAARYPVPPRVPVRR
jgi:hypothetical protein